MITYIIDLFVVQRVLCNGYEKEFPFSFVLKVRYELVLAMEKCKSLHIRSVPVPDPLKVPSESDGLGNIFVEPENHGAVRTFAAFDRSMKVQSCLKHCVVVVCLIIKVWSRAFIKTEFPDIFHEGIRVDVLELPVYLYFLRW